MVHRWLRTEAAQTLCLTHGKLHSSTFRCTCACVWVMRSLIMHIRVLWANGKNSELHSGRWVLLRTIHVCVWCNALIARARSTTTDAMGIALWQLLFVCVWHISFPHIYRVCLMLIIEWLLFTRNVCILISHSTECRATKHKMWHTECKSQHSFWHGYVDTATHSHASARARYNHLFALLCCFSSAFFLRCCVEAEIKPFRRYFISFRSRDMHVREVRQFCHVRNTHRWRRRLRSATLEKWQNGTWIEN